MAFIPGMNRIPGVYGPTSSEILKDDRGYVMGWAPIEFWSKNPTVFKTVREIARDIIIRHCKILEREALPGFQIDSNSIPFYGIIKVQWKPEVICTFSEGTSKERLPNPEQFLTELTKELKPLVKLLPFA